MLDRFSPAEPGLLLVLVLCGRAWTDAPALLRAVTRWWAELYRRLQPGK